MSVMDAAESQHLLLRQHRSITCDFKVLATWEAYLPRQGAQLKTGDHSVYYTILMCEDGVLVFVFSHEDGKQDGL